MTPFFILCALALFVSQIALPRRLAFLPLLIATCHLPNIFILDAGVNFTVIRILILLGVIRALRAGTGLISTRNPLDLMMLCWAAWAIFSTVGHNPKDHNPFTERLALVYDLFGAYLYARCFLQTSQDLISFARCLAVVLIPLALLMAVEQFSGKSAYSLVGGAAPEVRNGRIRAWGPFGHSILAGTLGATSIPILIPLLSSQRDRRLIVIALIGCAVIVISSASSGPIMSLVASLGAVGLYRWRRHISLIWKGSVLAIIGLHLIMKAPVWYLMARIDLTGASTGYHRAQLITSAVDNLSDWWLIGTDYTRNWMAYGITWSQDHIDITNYYIKMGVVGGLPLMFCYIASLVMSFQTFGLYVRVARRNADRNEFLAWCFGAALFAHCFTFLSVTYFDQSFVFPCMLIGAAAAIRGALHNQTIQDERFSSERTGFSSTACGDAVEPALR